MNIEHHNHHLFLALFISLSLSAALAPVSARLFTDPSSIPGWLSSHAPPGAWEAYRNFPGAAPAKRTKAYQNSRTTSTSSGTSPTLRRRTSRTTSTTRWRPLSAPTRRTSTSTSPASSTMPPSARSYAPAAA